MVYYITKPVKVLENMLIYSCYNFTSKSS